MLQQLKITNISFSLIVTSNIFSIRLFLLKVLFYELAGGQSIVEMYLAEKGKCWRYESCHYWTGRLSFIVHLSSAVAWTGWLTWSRTSSGFIRPQSALSILFSFQREHKSARKFLSVALTKSFLSGADRNLPYSSSSLSPNEKGYTKELIRFAHIGVHVEEVYIIIFICFMPQPPNFLVCIKYTSRLSKMQVWY